MKCIDPSGLTRSQYAAVCAWLKGVPVDIIAARWLSSDPDDAELRRESLDMLRAIREAVVLLAKQNSREDLASAVNRPVHSVRSQNGAIKAIRQIEALHQPSPRPEHSIQLWMARPLAQRLQYARLMTLADLMLLCNRRGHSWYREVPRIGSLTADRIVRFLSQHEGTLGALGAHVTGKFPAVSVTPVSIGASQDGPMPFESIRLPQLLDGHAGRNRAPRDLCQIDARNDYEAIQAWLARWPASSSTFRAYRKEVERFLAWSVVEQGRSLSDLGASDCVAYCRFLVAPAPVTRWCGPRVPREVRIGTTKLANPAWRPFTGPMLPRSRAYSRTVLTVLCAWLTDCRYLATNPWRDISVWDFPANARQASRPMHAEAWAAMNVWLDLESRNSARARLWRAAILLLSETGMRCQDVAKLEVRTLELEEDDLSRGETHNTECNTVFFNQQNGERRDIPMTPRLREALVAHWRDRDDQPGPALGFLPNQTLPPLARKNALCGRRRYSERGIRRLVEQTAASFSRFIEREHPELRNELGSLHPKAFLRASVSSQLSNWAMAAESKVRVQQASQTL